MYSICLKVVQFCHDIMVLLYKCIVTNDLSMNESINQFLNTKTGSLHKNNFDLGINFSHQLSYVAEFLLIYGNDNVLDSISYVDLVSHSQ